MPSPKPKVLVLLATLNGERFIKQQILSIHKQSNCDISILLSDHGSIDKTLEIVKGLKKIYKLKLKILINKKTNKGFSANYIYLFMNANIESYDYVALSDQDDIFMKNKFDESINLLNKKKCVGVSTSVKCFGLSKKVLRQSDKITNFDFLFEGAGQGCTFIIKANDFLAFKNFCKKNIGLIKNFYYHDWLIYLFFRAHKANWFFYSKPLTQYRIHTLNNTGEKYSIAGFLKRFLKILNGWYLKQIVYAIKIYNRTQSKSNQIKISFLNMFILIVFHGRRKFSDRFFSVFVLLSYLFVRKNV